jgi:hypothetical protein
MGAWGYGNFDNDDAADWVYEFETSGAGAVSAALRGVSQRGGDEHLDASEAAIALAAAEIVAAAKDGDLTKLSETARRAFATHRQSVTRSLDVAGARGVVERILRQSELKELWEEGKDGQKWLQEMDSLLARLR